MVWAILDCLGTEQNINIKGAGFYEVWKEQLETNG